MIIHLSRISPKARRIFIRRSATIPEDLWRAGCPSSVLPCTAWGFSCLANCSASGELLPRLFTLTCAFLKQPAAIFLGASPARSPLRHLAPRHYAPACRVGLRHSPHPYRQR